MTDLDRTEDFLLDGLDIAYERELVTTEERDEIEHKISQLIRNMKDRDSRVVNYNYRGKNRDLMELANWPREEKLKLMNETLAKIKADL